MSLFAALKLVPWSDVLAASPHVVKGARALLARVRKAEPPSHADPAQQTESSPVEESFDARIRDLENRMSDFVADEAATAAVIASLAEQNARLVEAVDVIRRRTKALAVAALVLASAVVGLSVALLAIY